MALEDQVRTLRDQRTQYNADPMPLVLQGVSKDRIRAVLAKIDRYTADMVDAVFALLDNETDSWFSRAPKGTRFSAGATTAHIGSHVGILQRGGNKLDREGRDYWIKPLRELGVIEPIYFDSGRRIFLPGHPVPKSSNSAYRLSNEFVAILQADEQSWENMLADWVTEEKVQQRANLQAAMTERSRRLVDTKHSDLIAACRDTYVPRFLGGYDVIFVDEADGLRVTAQEQVSLARAGVEITLTDAMPDILLWNSSTDWLWVIEAVTSDGEVDSHKVAQLAALADRSGKAGIGFTTAYWSWHAAATRQHRTKNIAPGTYIWIAEDTGKQLRVEEMQVIMAGMGETAELDPDP